MNISIISSGLESAPRPSTLPRAPLSCEAWTEVYREAWSAHVPLSNAPIPYVSFTIGVPMERACARCTNKQTSQIMRSLLVAGPACRPAFTIIMHIITICTVGMYRLSVYVLLRRARLPAAIKYIKDGRNMAEGIAGCIMSAVSGRLYSPAHPSCHIGWPTQV